MGERRWHSNWSFSDGNIILRVKSISPTSQIGEAADGSELKSSSSQSPYIHFRVHKSVLANHSEVFATMLSLPQPESQSSDRIVVDECDVVDLDDQEADIEKLLQVIYGFGPSYKLLSQASMDFYRPILILAKKYDMAKLIDLYLPHVIEGWPTNLDEWDGLEEEMQLKAKRLSKKSGTPGFVDDEFVEPASMLQLAHHFPDSLAPILPAVYYQLARTPSPKKGSPQWLSYVGSGGRTANWSFVPVSDYEALSAGQHAIKEHFLDLARRPHTLMSWPNPCSRVTTYSQKTMYCLPLRWWEAQLPGFLLTRLDTKRGDILAIYQELIDGFQSISSYNQDVPVWLCDPCRAAISSQLKPAREMFWNKLPEYFGIKASVIDL